MAGHKRPPVSSPGVPKGREKRARVHFHALRTKDEEDLRVFQELTGIERGPEAHWPKEIPPHMTFTYRVNPTDPIIGYKNTKDSRFTAHGPLDMFEHNFSVKLNDPKESSMEPRKIQAKTSPSPSSLSGRTSEEPRTPVDVSPDTSLLPSVFALGSHFPGQLAPWSINEHTTSGVPMFPHYGCPLVATDYQEDLSGLAFDIFRHNSLDGPYLPDPSSTYPDSRRHMPFPETASGRHPGLVIYEDRRLSLTSSVETATPPLDSQASTRSRLTTDNLRIQNSNTLYSGQQQSSLSNETQDTRTSPHPSRGSTPQPHIPQEGETQCDYSPRSPKHQDRSSRPPGDENTAPRHFAPPKLPTLPSLPSIFPPGWGNNLADDRSSTSGLDKHIQMGRQAGVSPLHPRLPADHPRSILHPVQSAYYGQLLPDRGFPGSSLGQVLRPAIWGPLPPVPHHEPRYDPLFSRQMMGMPHPPPLFFPVPDHFHPPFIAMPGLPAVPLRPEGSNKESWTEHFDLLQGQIAHKKRLQKIQDKFNRLHKIDKLKPAEPIVYSHPCPLCDRTFSRRNSLAIHMKWHYKERDDVVPLNGLGITVTGSTSGGNQIARPLLDEAPCSTNSVSPISTNAGFNMRQGPEASDTHSQPKIGTSGISSLLSTFQHRVDSPITPFATPPSTPSPLDRAQFTPDAYRYSSGSSHSRFLTGPSETTSTWSLFGSPE
ncbi:hypothetical protein BDW22DRAFT_759959 [Trametopsis cervina]|nr:hypothetical protein BDW22DRAFT_759959 [Trametopsis cervina]